MVALGLCCSTQVFSSGGALGLLLVVARRLLTVVTSLAAGAGLRAPRPQWLQRLGPAAVVPGLWSAGSVVVAHGLICSVAYGICPDQESNQSNNPLHWQAEF